MKRILIHISFWLAYTLQDALLEYEWLGPALTQFSEQQQLWMAFFTALTLLIPKLLFSYFVMYVIIPKILNGHGKMVWIVVQVGIAFFLAIVMGRNLSNHFINPVIHHGVLKGRPVFELSRILLSIMDIGFVAGLAVTLKLFRLQLAGKDREKNLVKEKLETELKFLRNQTNPHFLFNTLNNIYALARKKSDDTPEVVMKLSKLLRFMLYESKKDLVTITEEIKMLDDYLELEKIRYNERLTITFQKDIDQDAQLVAPLLLLPFIENAFKHGVSETRFNSFVHIDMVLRRGQLNFRIENTKEDNGSQVIRDNIGLSNVRRQLELMYKEYNLQVINDPAIFKVLLTINLNSHAKL